jgi:hypothetical protein
VGGTANTGGGGGSGGGGATDSTLAQQAGGSGVVVVRYPIVTNTVTFVGQGQGQQTLATPAQGFDLTVNVGVKAGDTVIVCPQVTSGSAPVVSWINLNINGAPTTNIGTNVEARGAYFSSSVGQAIYVGTATADAPTIRVQFAVGQSSTYAAVCVVVLRGANATPVDIQSASPETPSASVSLTSNAGNFITAFASTASNAQAPVLSFSASVDPMVTTNYGNYTFQTINGSGLASGASVGAVGQTVTATTAGATISKTMIHAISFGPA